MALFCVSHFTDGLPEISRLPSGHISIWYGSGVSLNLDKEEAQHLINGLTALLAEAPLEEVAA